MTDPRPTDEDELISRVLDGDATDVDRARVAADARLQARVQDFERVQAAIADVAPPSAAVQDAAVAAAIAHAAPVVASDERVRAEPLEHVRARRSRHIATVVAVAAAALIGIPLLAIALTGRGAEQKSDSTTAIESAADAPSDTAAPVFGAENGAAGYVGDLGALETDAQLQSAVALALSSAAASDSDANAAPELALPPQTAEAGSAARLSSSVPACINELATSDPGLGTAAFTAAATWQGEPALVVVYRGVTDTIVVVNDDCAVLARLPA